MHILTIFRDVSSLRISVLGSAIARSTVSKIGFQLKPTLITIILPRLYACFVYSLLGEITKYFFVNSPQSAVL